MAVERGSIFLQMVEVPHVLAYDDWLSQLMAFGTPLILRKHSGPDLTNYS